MATKIYLKSTYLPNYATAVTVVTVVTAVTVVEVVTLVTVETKKTFFTKQLASPNNFFQPDTFFTKKVHTFCFLQQQKISPKSQNVTKFKNSNFYKTQNLKM